ncbi:hypothetical protein N0V82_002219 [Gnomoniopsis sp. IMI 355080]|nr:hypothetical protein N0V82_002219 [Gnomoniopsis sp. IMI 355080]
MRAQQLHSYNTPYELTTTEPVPTPTHPDDLLIRVEAASYCHTDAVLAAGQMPGLPTSFPHVSCHEFAGRVVAKYSATGVSEVAKSFAPGTLVAVNGRAYRPCGECSECLKTVGNEQDNDEPGYSVYCPLAENNGISKAGGFRDYAIVDARQVALVPRGLRAVDAAPLMCAGVTIYGALKRCAPQLRPGGRVGIVGCGGGLGHLGLQFAVKMGYRVLGVDTKDEALRLAEEAAGGQEGDRLRIVDARKLGVEHLVEEEARVDAVIILPESQQAFDYGMGMLRDHGKCVVVSFPEAGFHVSARDLVFRDVTIVGSLVGSNKTLRETLAFAAEHNVRAKIRTFPLSQLNELVEAYHRADGGKLVVDLLEA